MQSAASIALPILSALVDQATKRTGSRMSAYEEVGRAIGESASWVRKFLGRQPVRLDADTFRAIEHRYSLACDRWETEAELQKARFFALRGRNNAMGQAKAQRMDVETGRRS